MLFFALTPYVPYVRADLYESSFQFNYDLTVDRTDEGTETDQTFNEVFETKFSQKLLPKLDFEYSFKFELENEFQSDAEDTTRLLPELETKFEGDYWELGLGWKRSRESNDLPFEAAQIDESYFIELFLTPEGKVPDLKTKYTVDTSKQPPDTNTKDTSLELSSQYTLGDSIKLKVDYTRDESDDRVNVDSDTLDETFKTEETFKYIFSDKVKMDFKHQYEDETGATLLDAGGKTNEENIKTHEYQARLDYRPFKKTKITADADVEREKDKIEEKISKTQDYSVKLEQEIGEPISLKIEYEKSIDEDRGGISDFTDTKDEEDDYTYEMDLEFSDLLDFSLKYERTIDEIDDRVDDANDEKVETRDASFSWQADTGTFLTMSFSYTWSEDFTNDVLETKDRKISVKPDLNFEALNLKITTDYTHTITEDFTKTTDQKERDIDFSVTIDYETQITDKLNFSLNHKYSRKVEQPGKVIERDDDTTVDFKLDEPWPGTSFGLNITRNASDRSEDESPPDINTTITFTWDHSMDPFDFALSYKYDKKKLTDNTETFDFSVGLSADSLSAKLTYTFDKTFSEELDESHSVSFTFQYEF